MLVISLQCTILRDLYSIWRSNIVRSVTVAFTVWNTEAKKSTATSFPLQIRKHMSLHVTRLAKIRGSIAINLIIGCVCALHKWLIKQAYSWKWPRYAERKSEREKEQKINMAIGMEIRCDSLARLWDCGLAFILALFSFEWGTFRWDCWKSNLIIGKYFHLTCNTIDDVDQWYDFNSIYRWNSIEIFILDNRTQAARFSTIFKVILIIQMKAFLWTFCFIRLHCQYLTEQCVPVHAHIVQCATKNELIHLADGNWFTKFTIAHSESF